MDVKSSKGYFLLTLMVTNCTGWAGNIESKSLKVEIKKDFPNKNQYNIFEYNGVKIFIDNRLKLKDNIYIYRKLKLPFIGAIYSAKGVIID